MKTTAFVLACLLAPLALAFPAGASHTPCSNEPQDVNVADLAGVDTGLGPTPTSPRQGGLTVCALDSAFATNLFVYHPAPFPYGTYGASVNPEWCNGFSCTSWFGTRGVWVCFGSGAECGTSVIIVP